MCTHSLGDLQVKNDAKNIYITLMLPIIYCDKGHYLLNRITIHFSAELNSLILKLDERYTADLEQCRHYHTKAKERRIAEPVEHGTLTGQ